MKRNVLFVLFVLGLAAMTWAQGSVEGGPVQPEGNRRPERNLDARPRRERPAVETVTVSGSLIIAHGSPAVKSGEDTYLLGGITRLTGFIDGLKEGAQVTIEGAAVTSPRDSNLKFLRPAKLTLAGKDYDLTPPVSAFGLNRQFAPGPGAPRQFAPNRQGPNAPQRNFQPRQRQPKGPRESQP